MEDDGHPDMRTNEEKEKAKSRTAPPSTREVNARIPFRTLHPERKNWPPLHKEPHYTFLTNFERRDLHVPDHLVANMTLQSRAFAVQNLRDARIAGD
eukprot:3696213-Pleurochrysis_carterae.AAC.1